MAGIFPDDGVVHTDTKNGVDVPTTGCADERFYSVTRCSAGFNPAAMNAIISELLNAMAYLGHVYDCKRLDNLAAALSARTAAQNALVVDGIGWITHAALDRYDCVQAGDQLISTGNNFIRATFDPCADTPFAHVPATGQQYLTSGTWIVLTGGCGNAATNEPTRALLRRIL